MDPERYISDLKWIFNSSPLMTTAKVDFSRPGNLDWLNNPTVKTKLCQFMASKNLKMLGTYFEALWQFYLENAPDRKLILKNLQVIDHKTTLGEFDFIYQDLDNQSFKHLEVAIKYYLGIPDLSKDHLSNNSDTNKNANETEMCRWLGPNINDRLDIKFYKLIKQQSKLGITSAAC